MGIGPTIDAQGQPFLDKEPLAPETMMPRLQQLASVAPSQVVLVRGDKDVPYGRIIEIMGQINAAGFSKVSLIAQAPSGSAAQ
jgi:biopolymer transport protein TolR